jgi:acetyl esterase/lipase
VGCPIQACADRARVPSPIPYITPDAPPFLLQHGVKDCTVAPGQSRALHEALRAVRVPSELVLVPGKGHGGAPYDRALLDRFFDAHLRACRP